MSDPVPATVLQALPEFLRAAGTLSQLFPIASTWIAPVLNTVASLVEAGERATPEITALTDRMRAMVNSQQDPTPDDWIALQQRSDAAHQIIQQFGT